MHDYKYSMSQLGMQSAADYTPACKHTPELFVFYKRGSDNI